MIFVSIYFVCFNVCILGAFLMIFELINNYHWIKIIFLSMFVLAGIGVVSFTFYVFEKQKWLLDLEVIDGTKLQGRSPERLFTFYIDDFKPGSKVLNGKDKLFSRNDSCVWLEFEVSPTELSYLLKRDRFHKIDMDTLSCSVEEYPLFGEKPVWFKQRKEVQPYTIYEADVMMQRLGSQWMIVSKDSTHVLYYRPAR